MEKSLLVQTMKAFSNEELQELSIFLSNSYFLGGSHAKKNLALFTLIKEKIQEKKEAELRKERILAVLFQKSQRGNGIKYLANRMSELMEAIRKYITIKEVDQTFGKAFQGIAVARFYLNRNLPKQEKQTLERVHKIINEDPSSQKESYLLRYWLETEYAKLESLHNKRKGQLNLSKTVEALTQFHAIKLMEIALPITQQIRVSPSYIFPWKTLLYSMREIFRTNEYFDNPTIFMMEQALLLIEKKEQDPSISLAKYLQLLNENEPKLPFKIFQNLAAYGRNYCNWQINKGHLNLQSMRFRMYRDHYDKELLFEYGKIIPSTFINMVYVGTISGENDWVLNLLERLEKEDRLNSSNPEKLLCFGYAWYYFQKNQFKKATEYFNIMLQPPKFEDVGLEIRAKILGIKLSYETFEDEEMISSQLLSFSIFIKRGKRKISPVSCMMNLNFIKMMKNIIRFRENINYKQLTSLKNQKLIQSLRNQISDSQFVIADRPWLLEKIEKLS